MALKGAAGFFAVNLVLTLCSRAALAQQPAREQLEAAAKAGRAEAAYELGLDYDLGTSGAEDSASALRWYRQAADAGLPAAEFNVGVMLDAGRGAPRDPAEAAIWYAKAAAHGHARAAYDLGQLYAAGDGPPMNQAAAAAWFAQASILPAAIRKLAALKAAKPGFSRDTALLVPVPASPIDGGVVQRTKRPTEAVFVWTAPAEPVPVRFFVELVALDGGAVRRLFAGFADATAVLARLEDGVDMYAWRVYAVDAAGARYASSNWARFKAVAAPSGD